MKCIVCKNPTDLKVPRHNAAFCVEHFNEHVLRQVSQVIKKFKMIKKNDRVLLGVSGGKDSMGAWKILTNLGYNVLAVHINNGFGEFSQKSENVVRVFAERNNLPLEVYSFEELAGFSLQRAQKHTRKPICSLCGTLKRYLLNRLAFDLECDVIATGHNLDDECAFLLGNVLHWQMGYLKRQYPILKEEKGLVRKIKPLARLTDYEMSLYVKTFNVDIVENECPYSRGATSHYYKDILNALETQFPGSKSFFYFGFLKRLKPFLFADKEEEKGEDLRYCSECGYKTLREDKCFVCALKEKIYTETRTGDSSGM